jgi:predicted secreted protein
MATTIHADDDGKSFDVGRGAVVTFSLPSNAGTGYVWVPTQVDGSVLTQQGDRTSDASSDVPGAPKFDVYHFAAAAPGTTTVEMSLKRPFGSAPPARIIHVTVNVR